MKIICIENVSHLADERTTFTKGKTYEIYESTHLVDYDKLPCIKAIDNFNHEHVVVDEFYYDGFFEKHFKLTV